MKLDTDSLSKYFTIATSANSHYNEPTNCFDFIDRASDTLVITVGDSWTYGSDLHPNNRIQEVYGNLISLHFAADFLNLGQPGSNNFFIADRVEELGKIVPKLEYKKIYLICTFTETGRSFDSHHDAYIDYQSWFLKNNIDDFLAFLNKECYNRILKIAKQFGIFLRIGTNFVDPVGFVADVEPWFRQLKIPCDIKYCVGHTGAQRLSAVDQFIQDKAKFKHWYSDLIEQSAYIDRVCRSAVLTNAHPNAHGHKIYANSIINTINE